MLTVLRRLEDLLVQVMRLVLLVFSLLLLAGMGWWLWQHFQPAATPGEAVALSWKDVRPDLDYMVEETGRDLGHLDSQIPIEKRLADPELRPSFQRADGLIRGFVYMSPRQRKRIEEDSGGQGLAPVHPLLKGDALPTPAEVQRQIRLREERDNDQCCGASEGVEATLDAAAALSTHQAGYAVRKRLVAGGDAAEDSGPNGEAEGDELADPVQVEALIHERAQAAEGEHGAGAYAAYVQGLPAVLEKVLGSESLAPRLREQPAQQLVSMLLINYTLSFDRAAQKLKGDGADASAWDFAGAETAVLSLVMSFLVLVVMVLVFMRMERHLRAISEQTGK